MCPLLVDRRLRGAWGGSHIGGVRDVACGGGVGMSAGGISIGLGGVSGGDGSGGWGPSGRGTGGISGNMYVPQPDQVQILRGRPLMRREKLAMKCVSQALVVNADETRSIVAGKNCTR